MVFARTTIAAIAFRTVCARPLAPAACSVVRTHLHLVLGIGQQTLEQCGIPRDTGSRVPTRLIDRSYGLSLKCRPKRGADAGLVALVFVFVLAP